MVLTLGEPNPSGSDDDERLVAPVQLVVSRGDSAKVFDATKEAFDQVTSLIEMAVEVALLGAVGARGDDRLGATGGDGLDQRVAVVGFVGRYGPGGNARQQRLGFAHVGRLAGGQAPAGEVAESFHQGMDLGGQAAARATDRLGPLFFGAPAAC